MGVVTGQREGLCEGRPCFRRAVAGKEKRRKNKQPGKNADLGNGLSYHENSEQIRGSLPDVAVANKEDEIKLRARLQERGLWWRRDWLLCG